MAGQAKLSILIAAKDDSAGALAKARGALGGIAKAAVAGAAVAGAALVGMGAGLYKLGADFDQAYDAIRVGTGATGDALEGLKDDFRAVAASVPADFADIGTAIADLNTRTGLTGEGLQELAGNMLNLTRLTGGDLKGNIAKITRTFGDWGINTEDQTDALNQLYRASQSTGIGIDSLNRMLVQFGAPLRQLGFSFAESTGLMGKFEKEGVNTELVMGSLRIALGKMAKAGKPARETLLETVEAIKNAGDASKANALALELFGARAGPDMAAAIREGRFELGELFTQITEGADTIDKATKDTEDAAEKWKKITNKMALAVEPLASKVFGLTSDAMDKLGPAIEKATPSIVAAMERVVGGIEGAIGKITDIVGTVKGVFKGDWVDSASIDPVTRTIGNLASAFRDALPTIKDVAGAIKDKLVGAFQAFNNLPPETKEKLMGVATAISSLMIAQAVVPGLGGLVGMLPKLAGSLLSMGPAGIAAAGGLAVATGAFFAWKNDWLGIRTALQPTVDWLGETIPQVFSDIGAAFSGGDGGGASGFVQGIVDAFTGMGDAIMGVVGPVIEFVAPSFQRLWDAIKQFASDVWPELQGAWSAMAGFFGPILQNILNIVMTVFGGIADFIGAHKEQIVGMLKGMWQVLEGIVTIALAIIKGIIMTVLNIIQGDWEGAWNSIKEMASGIWDGIKLIFSGALDYLKNLLSLGWEAIKAVAGLAWDALKTLISTKWEEIKTNATTVLSAYKTLIGDAWEAIKTTASEKWESVKTTISDAWEAIKTAVTTTTGELITMATELPGKMVSAIGDLSRKLWGAGAALIQGLIDGIGSKIEEVKKKLGELTGLLPSWKGPESADKLILFPAGQMIIGGLIEGMESQFPYVEKSLENVGKLLEAPIIGIGQAIPFEFADAFAGGWAMEVGPMLERAAGELRDVFKGIPAEFHTWAGEMGGGFEHLPEVFDRVGDAWKIVGGKMLLIGDGIIDMTDQLDRAFQRVGDNFQNILPPGGWQSIRPPGTPPPPDYHALMTAGPTGPTGGTNNLASIEEAVYRGAYRGTRAALAEAI